MTFRMPVAALVGLAGLTITTPVHAQGALRCLDIGASSHVFFTGRLTQATERTEGMAYGPERILVLDLPRPMCLQDGGDFADPRRHFSSIQVYATTPALRAALRRGIGRTIRVHGDAFAAQTGYHYRPLVLQVDRVVWAR